MDGSNLLNYLDRDFAALKKADSFPAKASAALVASGWNGGQCARWVDDGNGFMCLALADGRYCGFMPFGSNESGDQYTALTDSGVTYKYVTLFFGGGIGYTRTYERDSYISRNGGGPLVPLVYMSQSILYVSGNGNITIENESDPLVNPDMVFPDGTAIPPFSFVPFGFCAVPPHAIKTKGYLGFQTTG